MIYKLFSLWGPNQFVLIMWFTRTHTHTHTHTHTR